MPMRVGGKDASAFVDGWTGVEIRSLTSMFATLRPRAGGDRACRVNKRRSWTLGRISPSSPRLNAGAYVACRERRRCSRIRPADRSAAGDDREPARSSRGQARGGIAVSRLVENSGASAAARPSMGFVVSAPTVRASFVTRGRDRCERRCHRRPGAIRRCHRVRIRHLPPKPRAHGAAVMNHLDDVQNPRAGRVRNAERCTIARCPTGASTSAIATSNRTSLLATSRPTGSRRGLRARAHVVAVEGRHRPRRRLSIVLRATPEAPRMGA